MVFQMENLAIEFQGNVFLNSLYYGITEFNEEQIPIVVLEAAHMI